MAVHDKYGIDRATFTTWFKSCKPDKRKGKRPKAATPTKPNSRPPKTQRATGSGGGGGAEPSASGGGAAAFMGTPMWSMQSDPVPSFHAGPRYNQYYTAPISGYVYEQQELGACSNMAEAIDQAHASAFGKAQSMAQAAASDSCYPGGLAYNGVPGPGPSGQGTSEAFMAGRARSGRLTSSSTPGDFPYRAGSFSHPRQHEHQHLMHLHQLNANPNSLSSTSLLSPHGLPPGVSFYHHHNPTAEMHTRLSPFHIPGGATLKSSYPEKDGSQAAGCARGREATGVRAPKDLAQTPSSQISAQAVEAMAAHAAQVAQAATQANGTLGHAANTNASGSPAAERPVSGDSTTGTSSAHQNSSPSLDALMRTSPSFKGLPELHQPQPNLLMSKESLDYVRVQKEALANCLRNFPQRLVAPVSNIRTLSETFGGSGGPAAYDPVSVGPFFNSMPWLPQNDGSGSGGSGGCHGGGGWFPGDGGDACVGLPTFLGGTGVYGGPSGGQQQLDSTAVPLSSPFVTSRQFQECIMGGGGGGGGGGHLRTKSQPGLDQGAAEVLIVSSVQLGSGKLRPHRMSVDGGNRGGSTKARGGVAAPLSRHLSMDIRPSMMHPLSSAKTSARLRPSGGSGSTPQLTQLRAAKTSTRLRSGTHNSVVLSAMLEQQQQEALEVATAAAAIQQQAQWNLHHLQDDGLILNHPLLQVGIRGC
jgi:hypothetical protein